MPFHNLLLTSRNDILRFEWFSIPAAVCTSGRDADGMENREGRCRSEDED